MDIRSIITAITEKITGTFQQIQETVTTYLHSEKITISDLATFIKDDPNTIKTCRHLLGLDFNRYELTQGQLHFVLETKGKQIEKTLSLTLSNKGNVIIKYRSHDQNAKIENTVSIPHTTL